MPLQEAGTHHLEKNTLAGVAVSNGESLLLEIDSLEIAGGKLHLLMGPNGSGQSTLLRILAFLDKPAHGEMTFSGAPVKWNARNGLLLQRVLTSMLLLSIGRIHLLQTASLAPRLPYLIGAFAGIWRGHPHGASGERIVRA